MRMTENKEKLKELILYISERSCSHPKYGSTKLNKILFYVDFIAYGQFGKSITGAEYMRLPNGPAPRRLVPLRDEMRASRELDLQVVRCADGREQKRPINLRHPNLSIFSAEEISLVDSVIDALKDLDANQVSDLSHLELGWKVASNQETIPYSTIFLSAAKPTPFDLEKAEEAMSLYEIQA